MRGSLKIATMFGIPVHLHWTFGLIFLYAFYIGFSQGAGLLGIVWIVGLFIALFGCVLLHEFGHSLTARRYGIETRDIILTPIGGIARLEGMPEKPWQEFLVAIAGPMVNVVIAAVLFLVGKIMFSGDLWELFKAIATDQFRPDGSERAEEMAGEMGLQLSGLLFFLPVLLSTNLALVIFNLIPAFPMDGGRIFRSLLAMRIGRLRATSIAAMVGQAIAVIFVVYGLWKGQPMLALIGFFVFTTARQEFFMVRTDELLARFRAADLMRPVFTKLSESDWMQTPANLLRRSLERNFLIFNHEEKLTGILEEEEIVEAIRKNNLSATVGSAMETQFEAVHLQESLKFIYFLIRQKGQSIVPVHDQQRIVGVIDEAGLDYFLQIQTRIESKK